MRKKIYFLQKTLVEKTQKTLLFDINRLSYFIFFFHFIYKTKLIGMIQIFFKLNYIYFQINNLLCYNFLNIEIENFF